MASSHDTATSTSPTILRAPYPPASALLIYPATLIFGSLFSVLSPTAQPPSASPATQAQQKHVPINYFARKDNIFNLYFVKIGWIWMTLAFGSIILCHLITTARSGVNSQRRIAQASLRYVLVTLVWYFTTQWFFGPAIIDRSFVWTGGRCEQILERVQSDLGVGDMEGGDGRKNLAMAFSAAACKTAGGAWTGGHDVSGHVFMLVLVTAALGLEAWGIMSGLQSADRKDEQENEGEDFRAWLLKFVGIVIALSWWMLLMTAIWFHTWLEKLNGLLIALTTIYTIYILPRRVIPWRNIVGIPGV